MSGITNCSESSGSDSRPPTANDLSEHESKENKLQTNDSTTANGNKNESQKDEHSDNSEERVS